MRHIVPAPIAGREPAQVDGLDYNWEDAKARTTMVAAGILPQSRGQLRLQRLLELRVTLWLAWNFKIYYFKFTVVNICLGSGKKDTVN